MVAGRLAGMSATYAWTTRDVVTVSGPDAVAYLQGQISQDVVNLPVGESAMSFVLAPQGKVDGWGRVHRTAEDTYEIDVDPGAGEAWEARLRRFLLRTKADISVTPSVPTLAVRGEVVMGGLPTPGLQAVGVDVLGVSGPGHPQGVSSDAVEVGAWELEADRIRAGVPKWGAELDGDTIPATVGQWVIDTSVSFTKGCYTGQELVARIDSRGGNVPRHLMGVVIAGPPPPAGTEVLVDGAPAGVITSSAPHAPSAGSVALAFVPRSVEVPADGLAAVVAGTDARIRPLPVTV